MDLQSETSRKRVLHLKTTLKDAMRKTGIEGVGVPSKARSEARYSEHKDKCNVSKTRLRGVFREVTCSRKGHSSIVAVDEEHNAIPTAQLQNLGDESLHSDSGAGRSSGTPSNASFVESVKSTNRSESKCSKVMAAERDDPLPSVFASGNGKEIAGFNTGLLGNNCGVGNRALLETPCSQGEWRTSR